MGAEWPPGGRIHALCLSQSVPHVMAVWAPVITSVFKAGRRRQEQCLLMYLLSLGSQQLSHVLSADFLSLSDQICVMSLFLVAMKAEKVVS